MFPLQLTKGMIIGNYSTQWRVRCRTAVMTTETRRVEMRDIIITTDSNSDLPLSYIKEHGIRIISHYYEIDGETYGEDNLLTDEEFYRRMRAGSMPTTMASNPAVIHDVFQKIADEGKDALHISFSSALSGGCSNVTVGGREIEEINEGCRIVVYDSLNVSFGQGLMIMKAVELRDAGKSLDEITAWLDEHKMNFCVQFTVDDLHHLHRGGRVSAATAVIGTLASIKPILYVNEEGKLVALSKVRGRKKSLFTIVDNMIKNMGKYKDGAIIGLMHGDCIEDASFAEGLIREQLPDAVIITRQVGPSIGAHSGPGAVGLCFMGEVR